MANDSFAAEVQDYENEKSVEARLGAARDDDDDAKT